MLYLIVSLLASIIGAICGIGGGVIIKPVLDMVSNDGASLINFLSGCTVLSMSIYSVSKELLGEKTQINYKQMVPLALGAAAGGIIGRMINKKIDGKTVEKLFLGAMVLILLICALNVKKYLFV